MAQSQPSIPRTMVGSGRYASQGMIAPNNPFVDGDGNLTAVSFRFLHGLFQQLSDLQNAVGAQFSLNRVTQTPTIANVGGIVYMGLGFQFTPASTRAFVTFDGQVNNTVAGAQSVAALTYGTGPPPAAGAAFLGTSLVGGIVYYTAPSAGGWIPFAQSGQIAGLTPGTQYWVDLIMGALSGTANLQNADMELFGLIDPVNP